MTRPAAHHFLGTCISPPVLLGKGGLTRPSRIAHTASLRWTAAVSHRRLKLNPPSYLSTGSLALQQRQSLFSPQKALFKTKVRRYSETVIHSRGGPVTFPRSDKSRQIRGTRRCCRSPDIAPAIRARSGILNPNNELGRNFHGTISQN